jgi:hypothetical protein
MLRGAAAAVCGALLALPTVFSTTTTSRTITTSFVKPNCTYYFGKDADDEHLEITIVDVDVSDGYPDGNITFVHRSGAGSTCISPGPPSGCHRYFKVRLVWGKRVLSLVFRRRAVLVDGLTC